jgi:hypothetical protein
VKVRIRIRIKEAEVQDIKKQRGGRGDVSELAV